MSKNKKIEISLEEKLEKALVPVEEQAYKIPNNWVWVGLKYISKKIFAGGDKPENFSKIKTDKNIFPIFSNGIEKDGLYGYTNEARVLEKALTISARGTIGFTKIREANFTPIIRLIVIILKDRILYEFLDYYFKYNSLEGVGSSIPQLTVPIVNEKFIPLAPLDEQKRIVEKLDFLFEKTKRAKEIIEEIKVDIENRKISILDRAFKGILTSKWRNENKTSDVKELLKLINDEKIKKWEEDCLQAEKGGSKKPKKPIIREVEDMIVPVEEQPYKLPDNWVWVRLREVINVFRGLSYTKNDEVEEGNLVLRGNNLTDNGLTFLENIYVDEKVAKKGVKVKKDDVVLVASTGSSKVIGRACIVEEDYKKTTIGAFLLLCRPKETIVKKWVHYIFKTLRYRLYISEQAKGTNIKNIKNEYLENFFIPLPPLEEQKEIVRILNEVLENENKVKELLELEEKIDILEKSILNKAFKGELGTQNSKDEFALELLKKII